MMKLKNCKIEKEIIYSLFCAVLIITLCSRSSFLASYNNWDDANSYFSMGKGLFNGKVIYRDIFDQKGPYLYLIYGIGYLISHTGFFGVYLMEILASFFFLWGSYCMLRCYMKQTTSYILLPVLGAVIYSSVAFWWGGSAEEFCLPLLVWPLYFWTSFMEKKGLEKEEYKKILFTGICTGLVALIKFNTLGFFAAWGITSFFKLLLEKEYKKVLPLCINFGVGFLLPFLPWLLYFGLHGALGDWYKAYIYYNVFVYADFSRESYGIGDKIYQLAKILYWLIREHFQFFSFIILGVICFILDQKKKIGNKISLIFLCGFTFLGIYIGGVELKYYSLPLSVFTGLGFCYLGLLIERFWKKEKNSVIEAVLICFSLLISITVIWNCSLNTEYRGLKKEEHYLYRLNQVMEVKEDTTLLNISSFDIGLYTVTGIVPSCYWFQTQTLPIEDVLLEQQEYIRSGKTDYIVARDYYPEVIWEQYELIAEEKDKFRECSFFLFKKK